MNQAQKETTEPVTASEAAAETKKAPEENLGDQITQENNENAVEKIRKAFREAGKAPGELW